MSPLGNSCEVWLEDGLWYWEIIYNSSCYVSKNGFRERKTAEEVMQQEKEFLERIS